MAAGVRRREREGDKPLPTRHFSTIQENAVAKATGTSRTPNSGATPWSKGDTCNDQWLLECKTRTTHTESMSIKKEWIEKNRAEAAFMGKPYQAIVFNFGPDEENHYIIDEYLFQDLQEYLRSKKD